MSEAVPTQRAGPEACSGVMEAGVPGMAPVGVSSGSDCMGRAGPKSAIFEPFDSAAPGSPVVAGISRFDGLMSL